MPPLAAAQVPGRGRKPASGSQSTGALTASQTYGLTCTGPGGSASQSATVSVTSPGSPAVTSSPRAPARSPAAAVPRRRLVSHQYHRLQRPQAPGRARKPPAAPQSTGALTANQTSRNHLYGQRGGSATQSATVSVTQSASGRDSSASPSTVKQRCDVDFDVDIAPNATACTASGGWSGANQRHSTYGSH